MPHALDELSDDQLAIATHSGGPLLVRGGAGTGKTHTLRARALWLIERAVAPEALLVLGATTAGADSLRAALEQAIDKPYEELSVATFAAFCSRLLRDEALAAGLDPFAVAVAPADRLALLLEHVDELGLRLHDFGGNPAALLGSFVERIDQLKEQLITSRQYTEWSASLPESEESARRREFARVFATHDRMLMESGTMDFGDVVLRAHALLRDDAAVLERTTARIEHVLVDDFQDAPRALGLVLNLLVDGGCGLVAFAEDPDPARAEGLEERTLTKSWRCPPEILGAANAVVAQDAPVDLLPRSPNHTIAFWRAVNERAQAQGIAADVDRLITRDGVPAESIAIVVRSIAAEGQAIAVALEERAVPYRVEGAAAFFQRGEVRDVLAWLRLLADPTDHAAVVRALARPPIELRSADLARCIQIARRRKVDMISGLVAATESPQVAPEARDRILEFLKRYRAAAASLDTARPDLFVHRLIDRLGLRRQQLFAAQADVVARLVNLARFGELAGAYVRRAPQATPREFARYIAAVAEAGLGEEEVVAVSDAHAVTVLSMAGARGREWDHVYVLGLHAARMPGARRRSSEPVPESLAADDAPADSREAHIATMRNLLYSAMTRARKRLVLAYPERAENGATQPPSPFLQAAIDAVGGEWETREEELFGPAETLHATFRVLRDELLETIGNTGSRLSELRFDTELDISHSVARYLELVKLSALIGRPEGQGVADALAQVNQRLLAAVTTEQREILQSSVLDEYLLDAEQDDKRRAKLVAARQEPSLEAFLPRRGEGLVLSASDVETYRSCPLRYKFARVFRIPQEPTFNQRFGILFHQVLERFHAAGGEGGQAELLGLLENGWRRQGFGDSDQESQLRVKAQNALTRYHERFLQDTAQPVWFEKSFNFKLGPHVLRGRVDRVDRLPDGSYELIDYKTGRPRTAAQLKQDVQLSLYAVGAREAWQLEAAQQAYYYVLDDAKVPVPRDAQDRDWITETVMEVADGISSQGFEPTPSYTACSMCDYRIACPAAEK